MSAIAAARESERQAATRVMALDKLCNAIRRKLDDLPHNAPLARYKMLAATIRVLVDDQRKR